MEIEFEARVFRKPVHLSSCKVFTVAPSRTVDSFVSAGVIRTDLSTPQHTFSSSPLNPTFSYSSLSSVESLSTIKFLSREKKNKQSLYASIISKLCNKFERKLTSAINPKNMK